MNTFPNAEMSEPLEWCAPGDQFHGLWCRWPALGRGKCGQSCGLAIASDLSDSGSPLLTSCEIWMLIIQHVNLFTTHGDARGRPRRFSSQDHRHPAIRSNSHDSA